MALKFSSSKRAFSLLEVSIVILIIGVLIAGVISARIMIKNSRIASAQALTRSAAVNSVPDAVIWLESSLEESFDAAESEDDTSLSGWGDIKTGSSRPLNSAVVVVGADADDTPEYSNTINDIQAVKFHGSDDAYMTINGTALNNSDYTIFVLEKRQASNSNYFVGNPASSTEGESLLLGYKSGTSIIHSHDGSGEDVGYDSTVSDYSSNNEHPRIFTFVQNESTGKKTYINGYLAGEDANTDQLTNIGDALELGRGYNGEIGEFLVFERALRNEERKSIEQYLQKKWQIKNFSETADSCTDGEITDSGCAPSCSVSIVGSSSTASSVSDGADVIAECDDTGYDSVDIEATCSGGVAITGTCGCASGYDNSVEGTCIAACVISGETGILDQTITSLSAGTQTCDADNFTGTVAYTCPVGVFTKDSGQVCDTCDSGWDITSNCTTCLPGYVDSDSICELSSTPFTSTWDTTKAGISNSTSITLPLVSGGTYSFLVDWGDGETETVTSDSPLTHDYATTNGGGAGQLVRIYGDITGWRFNGAGDKLKLTNISKWGDLNLGNGGSYFNGCENLTITTSDVLDTTGTTNFSAAFRECDSLTTAPRMGEWDMSNVTNLYTMFYTSGNFNQDISGWNTSNVTNMNRLFFGAFHFNQDVSSWDTSSVTTFENTFTNAQVFNQNLSGWDTGEATTLQSMFINSYIFDPDLSSWDISKVTNATDFLKGITLSTAKYNQLLHDLASKAPNINHGVPFHGGNSQYDATSGGVDGTAARAILTGTYGWTITDDGGS